MIGTFDVAVSGDWVATRRRWAADTTATSCTPFQTLSLLDAWYASFAGQAEPLLVDVSRSGELAVRFAFAISGPKRVLTFADLGVSDFNAPILGPSAPKVEADARALWQAVEKALPRVDLIDLRKMPLAVAGRANPLAMLNRLTHSPMTGHLVAMPEWNAFHANLDRRVRMDLERSWRVFQRTAGAGFARIRDEATAQRAINEMDRQQRVRMAEVGQPFLLERPAEAAFYRHDLGRRLATGEVILSALTAGEDFVAMQYAVSNGVTPVVVRISNAGGVWSNTSPGRLIVHRTLAHLAAEGFQHVDLSIGDYDYKRRFGPLKTPLLDHVEAASWRGQASALKHRAVATLRKHHALDVRLRRMLGKHDPATGRPPEIKKGEA